VSEPGTAKSHAASHCVSDTILNQPVRNFPQTRDTVGKKTAMQSGRAILTRRQPMRIKIFSCNHRKPEFTCNSEIFQTLVSNLPEPEDGSFMSDLGGINIAGNNLYSELRHQFFVWKNLIDCYDYIGFEHYRRMFFIDTLPAEQLAVEFGDVWKMRLWFAAFNIVGLKRDAKEFREYLAMRQSLDAGAIADLKQWIGSYDVVVPRPNVENIEKQWKSCIHDDELWDTMIEGVNRSQIFRARPNVICFQLQICYFANMYIMRSDLLNEYLSFCFEVLAFCQSRLSLVGRALGYFSERLFSFWLYQKRIEVPTLRVLELPLVIFHPAPEPDQHT
jgi:hypothetical protein